MARANKSTPKATPKVSKKEAGNAFLTAFQSSWNKTVSPLRGATIPRRLRVIRAGRDLTLGLVSLLLLLIVASVVAFFWGSQLILAWEKQTSAAVVNGETISKGDLNSRLVQSYGDDTVQKMIDETLILQEGRKQNITVTQDEINSKVADITKQIAPQKLSDALSTRHLTMNDLTRQIKIQFTLEKILGKDIVITDKDLQSYFDQNKDTLAQTAGKDAATLTLNDVKTAVQSSVRSQMISAKYQPWIDSLRSKSSIKTFL